VYRHTGVSCPVSGGEKERGGGGRWWGVSPKPGMGDCRAAPEQEKRGCQSEGGEGDGFEGVGSGDRYRRLAHQGEMRFEWHLGYVVKWDGD
jgi:hypothetical protein